MKAIRSISSIILAALVLIASSSFYVDVHLCGGSVKTVAFLHQADDCGHSTVPPCHRALIKDCCENESIVHEAEDFKTYSTKISIPAASFIDVVQSLVLVAELIPSVTTSKNYYHNYHPPLRSTDRTIDLQVFLI